MQLWLDIKTLLQSSITQELKTQEQDSVITKVSDLSIYNTTQQQTCIADKKEDILFPIGNHPAQYSQLAPALLPPRYSAFTPFIVNNKHPASLTIACILCPLSSPLCFFRYFSSFTQISLVQLFTLNKCILHKAINVKKMLEHLSESCEALK